MTTLYGVRQETVEAYIKAERKKVWEEAADYLERASELAQSRHLHDALSAHANYLRQQAAKETHDAVA